MSNKKPPPEPPRRPLELLEPPRPQRLTDPTSREIARQTRERQWRALERIAEQNPLYVCWWNKNCQLNFDQPQDGDLLVCSLLEGNEILDWLNSHRGWTTIGDWSEERYAAPVWITDQGRDALLHREKYDLEPVRNGLVEPGWDAVPTEHKP